MGSKGYQTGTHVVSVTQYRRKAITPRAWEVMLAVFREACDRFGTTITFEARHIASLDVP